MVSSTNAESIAVWGNNDDNVDAVTVSLSLPELKKLLVAKPTQGSNEPVRRCLRFHIFLSTMESVSGLHFPRILILPYTFNISTQFCELDEEKHMLKRLKC